jgi:hypothetical protein
LAIRAFAVSAQAVSVSGSGVGKSRSAQIVGSAARQVMTTRWNIVISLRPAGDSLAV